MSSREDPYGNAAFGGRPLIPSNQALAPYGRPGGMEVYGYGPQGADDGELSLVDLWRMVVKHRAMIWFAFVFVMAVTLIITLLATPIYRSSITLQIERDAIKVVNVGELEPTESASGDRGFYETQYALLKSRALAERVVDALHLANNPVIERMREPSGLALIFQSAKSLVEVYLGQSLEAAEPDTAASERTIIAELLIENLTVEPVQDSRLVEVHFDSPDADFSARVANSMGEEFIAMNLERRFDASAYAKNYLEERLQQLKLKLQDSEQKLVQFAQEEGIVEDINKRESLLSSQLQEINTALAGAEKERIKAESRFKRARSALSNGLTEVLDSDVIADLKKKRAEFASEYQDKLQIYKPKYPTMVQLRDRIEELDKQIEAETGNIQSSVENEYQAAIERERLLENRLAELKADALDLRGRSIQYNILGREVDTNRKLYEGLLQRYSEVGVAAGVGKNNISVVDRAKTPSDTHKPKILMNLSVGGLVGLALGGFLAFVRENFDDSVRTPEDVERYLHTAVLGVIPKVPKSSTPYEQLREHRSALAEAYRSVRTSLQFSTDAGVPRSLLVTSATLGEGKSTTAVSLAYHFAALGKRVLLIDADLRRPVVHKALGVNNAIGLSNYLAGACEPTRIIGKTSVKNLMCVTSGPLPPNPTELLSSARLRSLLLLMIEKFDQIIIDGPPVLGLADAPVISSVSSGTMLVLESGANRVNFVRGVMKRLLMARARVLGVVLNKTIAKESGYYASEYYYEYEAKGTFIAEGATAKRAKKGKAVHSG